VSLIVTAPGKVIEAAGFSIATKLCRTIYIYIEINEIHSAFFASAFTGKFFFFFPRASSSDVPDLLAL